MNTATSSLLTMAVFTFGVVTLLFAVFERTGVAASLQRNWSPARLAPRRTHCRGRFQVASEAVADVVVLLWWTGLIHFRDIIPIPAMLQVQLAPVWSELYWPILGYWLFELGVNGRDWIAETGAEVTSLGELRYGKTTARPIRIVLAIESSSPVQGVADLPQGLSVSTEYPELTARFLAKHGIQADIQLSYGATEAKVPEIADAVVDLTETGQALRAAGLRIIETLLVSDTELIANPRSYQDPGKRHAMEQLLTLLSGTLEARGRVLVKLNVSEGDLDQVIRLLPALKSPTVSKLFGEGEYAVETVVAKSDINQLIPALKDHGATGIIELPISKIVH